MLIKKAPGFTMRDSRAALHNMLGLRVQRTMQGHDIRPGEQIVKSYIFLASHSAAGMDNHRHIKGAGDDGHAFADAAIAKNPDGAAGKFMQRKIPETKIGTRRPTTLANPAGMVARAGGQLKQQRKDGLGR